MMWGIKERVKEFFSDWFRRLKSSLHFRSVQLALLAGSLGGYFQAYPDQYEALVGYIPANLRPFVGILIFGILPLIARLQQQSPKPS